MNIIKKGETAILISAAKNIKPLELEENLKELTELAAAAGLHPLCQLKQHLKSIDSAFFIGSGKRKELEEKAQQLKARYIIFERGLSGVQTRNLEKLLKIPVLDRTQLILEIFAQRAKSREGKLQVELAQLLDQMPRMTGAWLGSLSRQGGRGAARGPGEKALETDRRQAQSRIQKIREKLEKVKKNRYQHRQARQKKKIPSFALIGYTNSGKSALLNRLTKSKAETKNQPFMTLDPKTRQVFIPGSEGAVITDTVGFIRDLPPHLISAFKATLEESASADILLHVVDTAHPDKNRHIQAVDSLTERFGWDKKPRIYVFNKMDLVSSDGPLVPASCERRVLLSAKTGWNIPALLLKMKEAIEELSETAQLFFPKDKEHKIYELSRQAKILKKEEGKTGTLCHIKIPASQAGPWKKYSPSKAGY